MPSKAVWGGAGKPQSPARTNNLKDNVQQLRDSITAQITANNFLDLPPDQIKSMTDTLLSVKTKKELNSWFDTLMLGEAAAYDFIRQRENCGLRFQQPAKTVSPAKPTLGKSVIEKESLCDDQASVAAPDVPSMSNDAGRGKKGKRGNVINKDSDMVQGTKFECGCFAKTHHFLCNCMNCGRIFCLQESDESCYFCGLDPHRCLAREIKIKNGELDSAAVAKNEKALREAITKRDQLLQYAKERAKRTIVVDDQSGQFSSMAWLTVEEREQNRMQEEARRKVEEMHKRSSAYTVHLDFVNQATSLGGPCVSDIVKPDDRPEEKNETQLESPEAETASAEPTDSEESDNERRVLPVPTLLQQIWYTDSLEQHRDQKDKKKGGKDIEREVVSSRRVQTDYYEDDVVTWETVNNNEVVNTVMKGMSFNPFALLDTERTTGSSALKMDLPSEVVVKTEAEREEAESTEYVVPKAWKYRDEGMCLSMHQPWASLLVAGIKTHEGRNWPTNFRGRLWIHAAAHHPSSIEETEAHYRQFCPADTKFPTHYPTSCLLGYVYLVDCLSLNDYQRRFPPDQRQETSEFTFVCMGAQQVLFALPMDGKHKIYKLERKFLQAAKKQFGEK